MKGVRVTSLEEFRENFDFTNAKDYLRQGRLSRWVRELGENDLADELDELKIADYSDKTLMDNFIGVFSLQIEPTAPEIIAPAEADGSDCNSKPEYSQRLNDIREKLENPDFSGKISAPREPQLIAELQKLLHEYFEQWSAALRKAPGKPLSSNRMELRLTDLAETVPFTRGVALLDLLTMGPGKSKPIWQLFDLPPIIDWTTVSRPEQLEKTKAIAAYYTCLIEFDYRLAHRKRQGASKSAPDRGGKKPGYPKF